MTNVIEMLGVGMTKVRAKAAISLRRIHDIFQRVISLQIFTISYLNWCKFMKLTLIKKHDNLYDFWSRSQGIWFSKLVTVTIRLLYERELFTISQIHQLNSPEFGIKMNWEYHTREELGQMSWCVDTTQPNSVFTDRDLFAPSPAIYDYRLIRDHQLVMTAGKYEETCWLEGNCRRLREQRYEGKLVRRLWENKVGA